MKSNTEFLLAGLLLVALGIALFIVSKVFHIRLAQVISTYVLAAAVVCVLMQWFTGRR